MERMLSFVACNGIRFWGGRAGRVGLMPMKCGVGAGSSQVRRAGDVTAGYRGFEIVHEKQLFHRYQTIYDRTVRYPNGQTVSYDVIGNARSEFKSVFVFPFDRESQTVTMLREYSPGRNRETMSFVAGMYEKDKHGSLEMAARCELSEEACLKGGELVGLTGGVAADKYSLNEFFYYLGLDAEKDERPGERDKEEWINVVEGVRLGEVWDMVRKGELNTPNSLLALLALDRLKEMGFN